MISPNNINFRYKKFTTSPIGQVLYHSQNFANIPNIVLLDSNYFQLYDATLTDVKIKLVANQVDGLAPGDHSFTFPIKLQDTDTQQIVNLGNLTINLTVDDTIVLNVTPTSLLYNFEVGENTPINRVVTINAENDWTITKNEDWVVLSTASGTDTANIEVGVNTTGLAPDLYTDTITINDGVDTVTINVQLTVNATNNGTDYLFVNPGTIKLAYTIGAPLPPQKNININGSASFTASVNVPWLNLPVTTGTAGASILEVALQAGTDLSNLTEGTYFATVTITMGTIVRTVAIELAIYVFTTETPSTTAILFTKDVNTISLKSSRLDTYLELQIVANYQTKLNSYRLKLPFFNGGASRDLGAIPEFIIGTQTLNSFNELAIYQPYFPVVASLEMYEKELFTETIVNTSSLSPLKFLKGYKPNNSFLSEISRTIFLSTKANLCFSVLSNNVSEGIIYITGTITKQINVSNFLDATKDLYSVFIPIASLGDFREGHELNITFLNETVKVVITEEGIESTMVYWENENGCFDALELRGEVAVLPQVRRTTASFRMNRHTTKSKILNVSNQKEYTINTGIIHTNDELLMFEKMLSSKNVYIKVQNQLIETIPSTSRIPGYASLSNTKSFDINFKNTEE